MLEEYADILTAEEACEALRVGSNAMYELLNSGKLKACRNGRTENPKSRRPGVHIGERPTAAMTMPWTKKNRLDVQPVLVFQSLFKVRQAERTVFKAPVSKTDSSMADSRRSVETTSHCTSYPLRSYNCRINSLVARPLPSRKG